MEPQIAVDRPAKTYRVPERGPGLAASVRSLFRRTCREVDALRAVSFTVEAGEMVGLVGPNGAGKTTTLKMLSGLLYPSAGKARVLGYTPWERRPHYLRQISMVLGNKSQMMWDIPPLDSFGVLGEIYGVAPGDLQRTLDELVELLDMKDLLNKPVRNFSLGERMKCELVAGLLHRPGVVFLDEPTLGLDVSMQGRLPRFFAEHNRRSGVTVILTSYYMADVVALYPRVILIHHGELLYDGELSGLAERLAPFRLIRIGLGDARRRAAGSPGRAHLLARRAGCPDCAAAGRAALGSDAPPLPVHASFSGGGADRTPAPARPVGGLCAAGGVADRRPRPLCRTVVEGSEAMLCSGRIAPVPDWGDPRGRRRMEGGISDSLDDF